VTATAPAARGQLGRFAHFALDLTHRQASILADRLDLAALNLGLTDAQAGRLQRLLHPEQFAVARASRPTKAGPGTRRKVTELARRRRAGLALWADGDAPGLPPARRRHVLVVQLAGEEYEDAWREALAFCGKGKTVGKGGRHAKGRALPKGCSVEAE
jgi:hypothetical protein